MLFGFIANAQTLQINVYRLQDNNPIGTITFEDSKYGLIIKPNLTHLSPGQHGFHIHEHPSCQDKGMAAGSHLSLKQTDKHQGPYELGHLGDLPLLIVGKDKQATTTLLAPKLTVKDIENHYTPHAQSCSRHLKTAEIEGIKNAVFQGAVKHTGGIQLNILCGLADKYEACRKEGRKDNAHCRPAINLPEPADPLRKHGGE